VAKRHQKSVDVAILANLANSKIFDFGESNKQERRALESKWSFTEIIRYLSENSPKDFDLQNTPGLLHMYGQQSHLIHADETALDLMLDRKRRAPVEKEILACAHVSRIFSDQVSLWTFSALALQYRYARQTEIGGGLVAKWDKVQKLTEPFNVRFNKSQKQFYDGFNNQ
jgi:hypothetical protein